MQNPLLLAVFVFALFLFIVFNAVSRVLYRRRHRIKYHFYQMFPYEFNYPSVFKENPYGNFLFVLSGFSIAIFYMINPYNSIYRIFSMIAAIAFTMVLICLIMTPLTFLKTHILLSCSTIVLAMVLPLFNLFLALEQLKVASTDITTALCIASIAISGLLSLVMLVLILNPKLTFKIYSKKVLDIQGKEVLKRPDVIYMALTEWMAIFIYFASPLGILLISLI